MNVKCSLENVTIHYTVFGKGKPIIMLHGAGPDSRSMIGCMEPTMRKRKGWKRIYPDLPGMGKTRAADCISSSDQMLDVLLGFIDYVAPGQQYAVAGASYGAYLSRGIVYKRTQQVDGLFLMCPVIIAEHEKRTLPQHITLVKKVKLPSNQHQEEGKMFSSFAVVQTTRTWKRTLREILPGIKIADNKFLDRLQAHGYPFTFDVDALPHPFRKPTLIIVGRQDSMVGYSDAFSIIEKYPRATLAVLDQAGHNVPIEQEHLFNSLVDEWLDRVESHSKMKPKK